MKRTQIETSVEAISERSQIPSGVLLKVEGMVRARQTGLEIAENGVDPSKLGNVFRLAAGDNGRKMATSWQHVIRPISRHAKATRRVGQRTRATGHRSAPSR